VSEVCVDMNARVKQGDVMAKLYVPEMEDDLKEKESLITQAKAEKVQSEKILEVVQANLGTALAMVQEAEAGRKRVQANYERWASEYQRMESIREKQVLDIQTLDESRNQFRAADGAREEIEAKIKSAQAFVRESQARSDKAKVDIDLASARLRVAQTEMERAKTMLQYAQITAPFSGIVTKRTVHTGHLLKPGISNNAEPLFMVVRMDRVRIFVDVPEAEAIYINPGVKALVRIPGLNDHIIEAPVTRTSWALDSISRTLRAEVELPNVDGTLRPGMYAYTRFLVERSDIWALPSACIVKVDDAAFCFQVKNGKAIRTPIRLGVQNGDWTEVRCQKCPCETGQPEATWQDFTGTEVVIQSNPAALSDGQSVNIP